MRRPSPATLIASVALFFSVGGGAFAATRLSSSSLAYVRGPLTFVDPGQTASSTAQCPSGDNVVSGGLASPFAGKVGQSAFNSSRDGWTVTLQNGTSQAGGFEALAVCSP